MPDLTEVNDRRSTKNQNDDALGPAAKVRTTTLKPVEGGSRDAQKVKPKGETEAQRAVRAAAEPPETALEEPAPIGRPKAAPWQVTNAATEARQQDAEKPAPEIAKDPLKGLTLVPEAWCATCGGALYDGPDGYLCAGGHTTRLLEQALSGAEGWEAAARRLRPHHGPKAAARLMGARAEDLSEFWAEEDAKIARQVAAQKVEAATPEAEAAPALERIPGGDKYGGLVPQGLLESPREGLSPEVLNLLETGSFTVEWAAKHLPPHMVVVPQNPTVPGAQYTVAGAVQHLKPKEWLRDPHRFINLLDAQTVLAPDAPGASDAPLEDRVRVLEESVRELARYADALNEQLGAAETRNALLARAVCRLLLGEQAPRLDYAELSRLMDLASQAR